MAQGQPCLVDTNILLRLSKPRDSKYAVIRTAVSELRQGGSLLFYTPQSVAEFWNVSTRPTERNGFGLSAEETERLVRQIEIDFSFLPDSETAYREWRKLIVTHKVRGSKVYDARLVASMLAYGITHLLTLNGSDFLRYAGITVVDPVVLSGSY